MSWPKKFYFVLHFLSWLVFILLPPKPTMYSVISRFTNIIGMQSVNLAKSLAGEVPTLLAR